MSKRQTALADWGLLLPAVVLVILSLTTLFSINFSYFRTQLIFFILSLFAYFFFSNINLEVFKPYLKPFYIISVFLLIFVLILGIKSHGAVRWLTIFGFSIQLSEILKPLLAFAFVYYLSKNGRNAKTLVISALLLLPVVLLIAMQPDLGSALIYAFVMLFALIVLGFPLIGFGVVTAISVGFFPIFWSSLKTYQKQRLLTFIHPSTDALGAGYNAAQAVIAVGSGMFFGKGLGEQTQSGLNFLPERQTDFIFATLSEALGFFGSLLVLCVFGILLFRIYRIYLDTQDSKTKYYALIAFFLILFQAFVNIGMNIGILPIVGVPLPFISYGGSSLLSSFVLLGILTNMSRKKTYVSALEIK